MADRGPGPDPVTVLPGPVKILILNKKKCMRS